MSGVETEGFDAPSEGGDVSVTGDPPAISPTPAGTDPWPRWGRLLGGAWIFFLGYPILAALNAPVAFGLRYGAVGLLVAFAVIYVFFFTSIPDEEKAARQWAVTATLVAITLIVTPVIGVNALGCGVFIIAFAIFHLPLRAAFGMAGTVLAIMVAAAILSGQLAYAWSILVIAAIVGLFTGVTRYVIDASKTHEETERHLLVARERERVARDVHDILGHTLTVVSMKAELASRLIDADPQRAKDEVGEIQTLSREAIAELRSTVGTLRARRLDDELRAAHDVLTDAGIVVTMSGEVSEVDPRFRVLFAWVVREAVTNIVRHSGATTCSLEIGPDRLRITDDGRGLAHTRDGNGLRGLKERVAEAGGAVALVTPLSGGTELTVTL